jgi:multidrug resistance efflux pump
VQGKIDDDDYIKMLAQIKREIAKAEELLEEYESQQKSNWNLESTSTLSDADC